MDLTEARRLAADTERIVSVPEYARAILCVLLSLHDRDSTQKPEAPTPDPVSDVPTRTRRR